MNLKRSDIKIPSHPSKFLRSRIEDCDSCSGAAELSSVGCPKSGPQRRPPTLKPNTNEYHIVGREKQLPCRATKSRTMWVNETTTRRT